MSQSGRVLNCHIWGPSPRIAFSWYATIDSLVLTSSIVFRRMCQSGGTDFVMEEFAIAMIETAVIKPRYQNIHFMQPLLYYLVHIFIVSS